MFPYIPLLWVYTHLHQHRTFLQRVFRQLSSRFDCHASAAAPTDMLLKSWLLEFSEKASHIALIFHPCCSCPSPSTCCCSTGWWATRSAPSRATRSGRLTKPKCPNLSLGCGERVSLLSVATILALRHTVFLKTPNYMWERLGFSLDTAHGG